MLSVIKSHKVDFPVYYGCKEAKTSSELYICKSSRHLALLLRCSSAFYQIQGKQIPACWHVDNWLARASKDTTGCSPRFNNFITTFCRTSSTSLTV